MPNDGHGSHAQYYCACAVPCLYAGASGRSRADRRDRRQGARRIIQTANGATAGYLVKLDKVKVGDIEVTNVDATVLEQGLGAVGLLGMSFLNRVEMQREGQTMTLIRRF